MPRPRLDRVRLVLSFRPRVHDRLQRLLSISGAESVTEVIRRALAVYETMLVAVGGGSKIIVRTDGTERELLLCPEEISGEEVRA